MKVCAKFHNTRTRNSCYFVKGNKFRIDSILPSGYSIYRTVSKRRFWPKFPLKHSDRIFRLFFPRGKHYFNFPKALGSLAALSGYLDSELPG